MREKKRTKRVSSLDYRLADVLITTEIGHKIHTLSLSLQITHLVHKKKKPVVQSTKGPTGKAPDTTTLSPCSFLPASFFLFEINT